VNDGRSGTFAMKLLALLVGVTLFLVVGEVAARVLHLDERDKQAMADAGGILAFTGLHEISDDPEQLYGLKPGARLELVSGSRIVTYAINSLGFRDVEFTETKPDGVFRILALGDSMTFGPGVDVEQTYPKVLERLLNEGQEGRYQVINAGASGYSAYEELVTWRNRGEALDPDLVIVGFCVNDVGDPRRQMDARTLEALGELPSEMIPNPDQGAGGTQSVAPSQEPPSEELKGRLPVPFKSLLREHSALYRFFVRRYDALLKRLRIRDPYSGELRRYYRDVDAILSDYSTPEWQWLTRHWEGFQEVSEQTGVPWVLVLFPWQYQLERDYEGVPQERLNRRAREMGIFVVDPRPVFQQERFVDLYIDLAHFSAKGHQLAAEVLHDALEESALLPES
jgi:lysophospholipase L1-like esterase